MKTLISNNIKSVLLLSILFLWGCTTEDLSQCNSGLSIAFNYTNNISGQDLLAEQVKTLDLFMYDENGDFAARKRIKSEDLGPANSYPISFMPVGDYTIVVWGNMDASRFRDSYISKLTDMKAFLISVQQGNDPETYPLFHAMAEIRAKDKGIKTISLIKISDR